MDARSPRCALFLDKATRTLHEPDENEPPENRGIMRIHRLEVEGFRSLKKVSWEPGALNVVIGPNGSGKSNLLQTLTFFQVFSKGLLKEFISSKGGPISCCWDGQTNVISFYLTFDLETSKHHGTCTWSSRISVDYFSNNYSISSEQLFFSDTNPASGNGIVKLPFKKSTYRSQPQHLITELIRQHKYESIVSPGNSDRGKTKLETLKNITRSVFGSIMVYSYFDTGSSAQCRQPVITGYDGHLNESATNLIQVLHTLYSHNRDFKSDADAAMSAAFGTDYEELVFAPASDQRIQLRIRWKSLKREQSALDISDGTLRFLYLLAILANPEPAPLIAIDEPETGLHPSMFPIIAEFAQECSRKSQVIFTTHSPQFLDAFGDSPPTTTVAQWHEGETLLKVLEGERLAKWLKHYSLGQVFMSGDLEEFA